MPAGENPPPGAIVDYYLPSDAGEVKLEFLNTQGKVMRTYSSTDPVLSPDPATDPVAYNKICQQTPTAADCGLPLYWPAPPQILKATAGMHRFTWDMHYDPIPGAGGGGRGGGGGPIVCIALWLIFHFGIPMLHWSGTIFVVVECILGVILLLIDKYKSGLM